MIDVPFGEIERALGRAMQEGRRAWTATVVAIGAARRVEEAAGALRELSSASGVRGILICTDCDGPGGARVDGNLVLLDGLKTKHVNNAVAALRLSSLPTLVWWRGGAIENLDGLAGLADRLVLDEEEPARGWARAAALAGKTAISDLRWARLTRWRALMAHFFDIPEVRALAPTFRQLEIAGADQFSLRLFAGWLSSSLPSARPLSVDVMPNVTTAPLERVRLADGAQELVLRLLPNGSCVEATARVEGHAGASRIVALGSQGLAALVAAELRIRSRDVAFERALRAAEGVA